MLGLILNLYFMVNYIGDDINLVKKIGNYGCWCQFDKNIEGRHSIILSILDHCLGRGTPVDALDDLCRKWHQCRSCTKIDDQSCDQNLGQHYGIGYDHDVQRVTCATNSECVINICKCDEELAYELFQAADNMSDQYVTNSDGSGFDHANQCGLGSVSSGGNGGGASSGDTKCCGAYPQRVTYNTANHDCCSGALSDIGTCQT